jgi:acetoin utilization deacetylase AcuC-like enzyme
MGFGLMTDERFLRHRSRYDHPERPERLRAILNGLESEKLLALCQHVPARGATREEMVRVHEPLHVDETLAAVEQGWGYLDPDTFYSPGTRDAALLAAGGTIDLARAVFSSEVDFGFALNRPPGHHATRSRCMGFCLFNHLAAAAAALLDDGVERILVFDWDVHHGNGTQEIFIDDPRVLYISVHQWPHFPGSGLVHEIGRGEGKGFTVNIPFPPGSADGDYFAVMSQIVEPLSEVYAPEVILVSAGFDAYEKDMLGGMRVSIEGFAFMAKIISQIAEKTGRGPCFVLEGGYDLQGTSEAVIAVIETMLKRHHPKVLSAPSHGCLEAIEATLDEIAPFWPDL